MRILLVVMLLVSTYGCVRAQVAHQAVRAVATKAADIALSEAIWVVCKGSSVGSVTRRFLGNAKVWNDFCSGAQLTFSEHSD